MEDGGSGYLLFKRSPWHNDIIAGATIELPDILTDKKTERSKVYFIGGKLASLDLRVT